MTLRLAQHLHSNIRIYKHGYMNGISMKMPYVTHCWRCDTFYKTSFSIGTAIINLFALVFFFLPLLWVEFGHNRYGIYLPTHLYNHSAGASNSHSSTVTHIFGFLTFAMCWAIVGNSKLGWSAFSLWNAKMRYQWNSSTWQLFASSLQNMAVFFVWHFTASSRIFFFWFCVEF